MPTTVSCKQECSSLFNPYPWVSSVDRLTWRTFSRYIFENKLVAFHTPFIDLLIRCASSNREQIAISRPGILNVSVHRGRAIRERGLVNRKCSISTKFPDEGTCIVTQKFLWEFRPNPH